MSAIMMLVLINFIFYIVLLVQCIFFIVFIFTFLLLM